MADLAFWPKVLCYLILIPLAAFLGREVTVTIALCLMLFLARKTISDRSAFAMSVGKYVVPLAIGLFVLHGFLGEGVFVARVEAWLVSVGRFSALLGYGLLFTMTTNPLEIPHAAMEAGLRQQYGVGLMVAFRLVPLLGEKLSTIVVAQRARGAVWRLSIEGIRQFPQLVASLVVPSVYAALEMSLALSDTLFVRGYLPERRMTRRPKKTGGSKANFVLIGLTGALMVCAWFERMGSFFKILRVGVFNQ